MTGLVPLTHFRPIGERIMRRIVWSAAAGLLGMLGALPIGSAPADNVTTALEKVRLTKDASLNALPEEFARSLEQLARGDWKPLVTTEKSRGAAAVLYPKVGPAVVVVRTADGHGTGVFISSDGWLLTNQHVIRDANLDAATGTRIATIHFGRYDGEQMRLVEEELPALVYKSSFQKDLALLKITKMPKGIKTVPHVELAAASPKPGSACVAIGHPAAGLLWSVRSGEVAGTGEFPKDLAEVTVQLLDLSALDRKKLSLALQATPKSRKILLTNCGGGPGDSGGPLVNEDGKLIAITFAVPTEKIRGSSNFLYHVHLDEVKEFVAAKPADPEVLVPSPWPTGVYNSLKDLSGTGKPEVLLIGPGPEKPINGMLIDLKGASDKNFKPADLNDPEKRKGWKFQFAFHVSPVKRTFYDTKGDGTIDLILLAAPGENTASVILRRNGDVWKTEAVKGRPLIDPLLFKDKALTERLEAILKKFGS